LLPLEIQAESSGNNSIVSAGNPSGIQLNPAETIQFFPLEIQAESSGNNSIVSAGNPSGIDCRLL